MCARLQVVVAALLPIVLSFFIVPAVAETVSFYVMLRPLPTAAASGEFEASFDTESSTVVWRVTHESVSGSPTRVLIKGPTPQREDVVLVVLSEDLAALDEGTVTLPVDLVPSLLDGQLWVAVSAGDDEISSGQLRVVGQFTAPTVLEGNDIGGGRSVMRVETSRYPATFAFSAPFGVSCTSTVVGPRVLLTAAHCIDDGMIGHMIPDRSVPSNRIAVQCHRHPLFRGPSYSDREPWKFSSDFALCVTTAPIPIADIESISMDHSGEDLAAVGAVVALVGYGCTDTETAAEADAVYVGVANVIRQLPQSAYMESWGAHSCAGDSGGPVFLLDTALRTPDTRLRWIVGVSSVGLKAGEPEGATTKIATTGDFAFSAWARLFAEQHDVDICGVTIFGEFVVMFEDGRSLDARCRGG